MSYNMHQQQIRAFILQ